MYEPGAVIAIHRIETNRAGKTTVISERDEHFALPVTEDLRTLRQQINKNGEAYVIRISGRSSIGLALVAHTKEVYERNLILFFYDTVNHTISRSKNRPKYRPLLQHKSLWKERWRMATAGEASVQGLPLDAMQTPSPKTSWMMALCRKEKRPAWIMPVPAPRLREGLPDHSCCCFFPGDHYRNISHHTELPSIYPRHKLFPQKYRAQLIPEDRDKKNRQVTITVHGFLRPEISHYKFWTHVVGGSPEADRRRPDYGVSEQHGWQKLLAWVPDKQVFLLAGCRVDNTPRRAADCPCLKNNDQYRTVHTTIKRSFDSYLEQLGLLMATHMSNAILSAPDNAATCFFMANILGRDQEGNHLYPFLGMSGSSYNWNNDTPAIHLHVDTFFLKDSKRVLGGKAQRDFMNIYGAKNMQQWRLADVTPIR